MSKNKIKIKGLDQLDFANYKEPVLFIAFPNCSFKCDKEAGNQICQNGALANSPTFDVSIEYIMQLYFNMPITKAIVLGGLEPLDSMSDVISFISAVRAVCSDTVIIYTGYTEEEIGQMTYIYNDVKMNVFDIFKDFGNIVLKVGRFIPNKNKIYDKVLGIELASDNQYAINV